MVKIGVKVEGLRATLRKLSVLDDDSRELTASIRSAAQKIADAEASRIVAAGQARGSTARLAARSVRAVRDRDPKIVAGGGRKLGHGKADDLFFGAEFGGQRRKTTMQFPPHRGTVGYWYWPTLREDAAEMAREWSTVVDDIADAWESSADRLGDLAVEL